MSSVSKRPQRQPAHPARVELQLLAGLAVGDGHRRRRAAKSELEDGELTERRIRQLHGGYPLGSRAAAVLRLVAKGLIYRPIDVARDVRMV